jgi:drug/metabolite transporter (DMT)-like permease
MTPKPPTLLRYTRTNLGDGFRWRYNRPMAESTSRYRAVIFLVLTAFLWSSSGLLIKMITWQPLAILGGRSIVAGIVILAYLRRIDLRLTRWQVLGALSYVGTQLTFITATKLTTAANAIFLQYTAPVYVLLLGWLLLRERPRRTDWITMLVIFAGLLLFLGDDLTLQGMYGNLLAIVSGVLLATMTLCTRREQQGTPANIFLLGTFIGALIGLPALLGATFSPANVGIIAYLGTFQMGLALIFYSVAIKHVRALEATLILTLEPILNPIWVFLVIGETPSSRALLGAALVFAAVTIRSILSVRGQ